MLFFTKKIYICLYFWLFFLKRKSFIRKNFFLNKIIYHSYMQYLYVFLKKQQFCFFKKRLLLIKFWKTFIKKLLKLFFKKSFNYYFFYFTYKFVKTFKKPNYIYLKKFIFLKFFLNKLTSFCYFKNLKSKILWNIYIRKFNVLKKYFFLNIRQFFFMILHLYKYKQIFLTFQFYSNINFFILIFYQLKNIFFKICFFFNWNISILYLKTRGLFISGIICLNYIYFCNPYFLLTYQLIWSNNFYYIYWLWYSYYNWQVMQLTKINWLYFFRRYIQYKTYRLFLPKWIFQLHNFYWFIPLFLEVSFITLTFFLLPIYFNLVNIFYSRYINLYNHRLYLWKYLI